MFCVAELCKNSILHWHTSYTFASCYICVLYTQGVCSLETFFFWGTVHPNHLLRADHGELLYLYRSCIWKLWCGLKPELSAALQSHKDIWSLVQKLTQSCSYFPYHRRLGLVNYFIAIYLVLLGEAIPCLVQLGSPSSRFTWHLILWGNQPAPFNNGEQVFGRCKVAQSSKRTNQRTPHETPAPATLANMPDSERPTPISTSLSSSPIPSQILALPHSLFHCQFLPAPLPNTFPWKRRSQQGQL